MISKTLKLLAERIVKNHNALDDFYFKYRSQTTLPFYCSVDLRDSGYKIVPVDSNLYPAGFNNICPEDRRTAPPVFKEHIDNLGLKSVKKILILPESHTQNAYYIENLYYLEQIIQSAGFETKMGWYQDPSSPPPPPSGTFSNDEKSITLVAANGKELKAYPIQINQGVLSVRNFIPDIILLNNDFSSGYPKPLDEVIQPIFPSHKLGWHSRKKSEHFTYYNQLAGEVATLLDIDPWILQIDSQEISPVNFSEDVGIEEVAQAVHQLLERTKKAYEIHQIDRKPFAFVKNNAGTYGMGIMVVHSAEEVKQVNRRIKNKMSVGKNRLPIESVLVQEGIPTATLVNHLASEPVIYLVGSELIGGFLRSNTLKGTEDNLNSQGMIFKKLCMSDLRLPSHDFIEEYGNLKKLPLLELVYGTVAKISTLASGLELAKQ